MVDLIHSEFAGSMKRHAWPVALVFSFAISACATATQTEVRNEVDRKEIQLNWSYPAALTTLGTP